MATTFTLMSSPSEDKQALVALPNDVGSGAEYWDRRTEQWMLRLRDKVVGFTSFKVCLGANAA